VFITHLLVPNDTPMQSVFNFFSPNTFFSHHITDTKDAKMEEGT